MSKTAWSRSAKIQEIRNPSPVKRGKSKINVSESNQVSKLEALVAALRKGTSSKDPKGGCFCQARVHPLSKYTPICFQCGLVLCSLHSPLHLCPHCTSPLMTPASRETLIQQLIDEISDIITLEAEHRKLEQQELERAAGAFPTLSTSTSTSTSTGTSQSNITPQSRKVLSLNSQTGTAIVSSYLSASSVATSSGPKVRDDPESRVPPPPKEVDYIGGNSLERPWQNLRDGDLVYVPPPNRTSNEGLQIGRRKKKGVESNSTTTMLNT